MIPNRTTMLYKARNLKNMCSHGIKCPKAQDLVVVNTSDVKTRLTGIKKIDSGRILGGSWDEKAISLFDNLPTNRTFELALKKFDKDQSWLDSEAFDYACKKLHSKGYKIEEIYEKYRNLDKIEEIIRSTHQLPRSLEHKGRREINGVYIHIGRSGQPIFGGGGSHRLAMAIRLNVKKIPVQIGLIHEDFIGTGWDELHKLTVAWVKCNQPSINQV